MPSNRSVPIWSKTAALTTSPVAIYLPDGWSEVKVSVDGLCFGGLGGTYDPPAVGATSGVITLQELGAPTGGNFTLEAFSSVPQLSEESAVIAFDASAATIKSTLAAMACFSTTDITSAGGALNVADVTLQWAGVYDFVVPPLKLGDNNLTGPGNHRIRVFTSTVPDGNGGYAYIPANTQEVWKSDRLGNRLDAFLYLAAVSATATAQISAYR